jgi:Uma2 family endonuclease
MAQHADATGGASEPIGPMTLEEYYRFEEASDVKHEFVAGWAYPLWGDVHGMVGASRKHNTIGFNIARKLADAAEGGPCSVYLSDVKLQVADGVVYYPDVQVVCEPEDANALYTTQPCVVVEVLSPSTASLDRREKLLAYRGIERLQTYLIVAQDERRVVRHARDEDGAWHESELVGRGAVPIPCLAMELTLDQIYRGVDAAVRTPAS